MFGVCLCDLVLYGFIEPYLALIEIELQLTSSFVDLYDKNTTKLRAIFPYSQTGCLIISFNSIVELQSFPLFPFGFNTVVHHSTTFFFFYSQRLLHITCSFISMVDMIEFISMVDMVEFISMVDMVEFISMVDMVEFISMVDMVEFISMVDMLEFISMVDMVEFISTLCTLVITLAYIMDEMTTSLCC